MLNTLADKVRAQHTAVLLVDVQNDFCAEGGAHASRRSRSIAGPGDGAEIGQLRRCCSDGRC